MVLRGKNITARLFFLTFGKPPEQNNIRTVKFNPVLRQAKWAAGFFCAKPVLQFLRAGV
jgi:hypothetical protein